MRLGSNLAAGLAYSAWSTIIGIATVPIFLRYVGVEAYGLIGFYTAMQGLLMLLDVGLAPAISREVARATVSDEIPSVRNLLRSLAFVYWGTALLIGLFFTLAAPFIAHQWLNVGSLDGDEVTHAILLMGITIACRWPAGLYLGALMGAQRLTLASAIGAAWVTLANAGAVPILIWWSPTITAYFLWQAIVGLAYALAMKHAAWRTLANPSSAHFDWAALKTIWKFAAGMSIVSLTGVLFTQLDKVILSKILSLQDFAYYTLATVVAGLLYRIVTPVFNVIYPRFASLIAAGDEIELAAFYRLTSRIFATLWFPGTMAIVLCAEPLLRLWTGDPTISEKAAPLLVVLTIGSALHGAMYFPYALQLAYGATRLPLAINGLLVIIQIPLIFVLATSFGALGGAIAWLVLHVLYLLVGTWWTHRHLLVGAGSSWLVWDIGGPLAASLLLGIVASPLIAHFHHWPWVQLAIGLAVAGIAILLLVAVSPYKLLDIRQMLIARA